MQLRFTRFLAAGLLAGSLVFTGCADDGGDSSEKAIVDTDAMSGGVMVTVTNGLGEVIVPLSEALPDVPLDEITQALAMAVSLTVQDDAGVTANLITDGTLVNTPPANPGEYMWEVSDDRMFVRFTFFNQTPGGSQLRAGGAYTAIFVVSDNNFVENTEATIAVSVAGS